jgi:hypothetical protein
MVMGQTVEEFLAVDRARMIEIIRITPSGAEKLRDEAIQAGTSVSEFRGQLHDRAVAQLYEMRGFQR